jgi:hypothetical protein
MRRNRSALTISLLNNENDSALGRLEAKTNEKNARSLAVCRVEKLPKN